VTGDCGWQSPIGIASRWLATTHSLSALHGCTDWTTNVAFVSGFGQMCLSPEGSDPSDHLRPATHVAD